MAPGNRMITLEVLLMIDETICDHWPEDMNCSDLQTLTIHGVEFSSQRVSGIFKADRAEALDTKHSSVFPLMILFIKVNGNNECTGFYG